MVQSSVPLSTHLDLFEKGIAEKLDFAYAGPQDGRLAQLIQQGKIASGRSTPIWSCSAATLSISLRESR